MCVLMLLYVASPRHCCMCALFFLQKKGEKKGGESFFLERREKAKLLGCFFLCSVTAALLCVLILFMSVLIYCVCPHRCPDGLLDVSILLHI